MRRLHCLRSFFSNAPRSHTHELHTEFNETHRMEDFIRLYTKSPFIKGKCSVEGTQAFSKRYPDVHLDNWKHPFDSQLSLSSVGIGSYSTDIENKDDLKLFNAIIDSALLGVNVMDTCSQFRYSKGERIINAALKFLIEKGYSREEFFVCSKLGYLSDDADLQTKGDEIVNHLIKDGYMKAEDVVEGVHCIHPSYLEYMFARSKMGLGLEAVDVMYLNNFPESQMEQIGKGKFEERLAKAFEFFESKVQNKQLQYYGLSSFSAFRTAGKPYSVQLQEVERIAEKVGGKSHKFRFLMVPMNIMASEAFGTATQTWKEDGKADDETTVVAVANRLKINIASCSPFMRGTLINVPVPGSAMKCTNNGAKHLQFIRSIPTPALLTTLVGQNLNRHVKTNLQVLGVPRLTREEWLDFVKPSVRKDVDSE